MAGVKTDQLSFRVWRQRLIGALSLARRAVAAVSAHCCLFSAASCREFLKFARHKDAPRNPYNTQFKKVSFVMACAAGSDQSVHSVPFRTRSQPEGTAHLLTIAPHSTVNYRPLVRDCSLAERTMQQVCQSPLCCPSFTVCVSGFDPAVAERLELRRCCCYVRCRRLRCREQGQESLAAEPRRRRRGGILLVRCFLWSPALLMRGWVLRGSRRGPLYLDELALSKHVEYIQLYAQREWQQTPPSSIHF